MENLVVFIIILVALILLPYYIYMYVVLVFILLFLLVRERYCWDANFLVNSFNKIWYSGGQPGCNIGLNDT